MKAAPGLPHSHLADILMYAFRPHTLSPQMLYLAHLAPYLSQADVSLKAELNMLQSENEDLADTVAAQRDEIENMMKSLESVIENLEGTKEVLERNVDELGLRKEISEIQNTGNLWANNS